MTAAGSGRREVEPGSVAEGTPRPGSQPWPLVLALFSATSAVETMGVSQVSAFMPLYLRQMGLPASEIPHWVGVLNSLVFVLGLPLVPLWGVWADKYSRKVVIIRSALVQALVFFLVALSGNPLQLAGSLLLVGFQLGNTGVMMAMLREVTPRGRLGTALGLLGGSTTVGFALGPALGGLLVDGLQAPLWTVYALSGALSLAAAALLAAGLREVRPRVVPAGRTFDLAYGALRSVFTDPTTRRLFSLMGLSFLARQMANPFLPILVERVNLGQAGLASAVALVVGTAALVGGLVSPVAGVLGDRIGFYRVLALSILGSGLALASMPVAPTVLWLALASVAAAGFSSATGAMIFALLAGEVPPSQRSATLNLVYLPLYLAGIVGPSLGALVVTAGVPTVFLLSGLALVLGGAFVISRRPRT